MNGIRVLVTATAGAVALGLAATPAVAATTDYFPADGSTAYDVSNYSLQIRYEPASAAFTGDATIKATASQAMSSFNLDLRGFTVRSVSVNGKTAAFRRTDRKLIVTPPSALAAGADFAVEVRYDGTTGRPLDPTGALYGWVSTPDGAFVANEPDGASTWFPVNDRLTDKATYDMQVTVPAGKTAVSNGDLVGAQTAKGWTTWQWRATDPMSSYLATVSIGDYDLRRTTGPGGLPVLTAIDRKLPAGSGAGLARINDMVGYFSGIVGPFPFTSYGAIVDNNDDAGYDLETQTRPIYAGAPDDEDVAHETAHQWFGDAVTPKQWQDIWLSEGLTTYLEWRWEEHVGGDSMEQTFADAYAIPAKDDFWSVPVADPGVDNMFADPVLIRGAMTLQALNAKIGDDAFGTLLHRWYSTYRGGSASTTDFINLAEQVSGRDLDTFFQNWLYKTQKPAATPTVAAAAGVPLSTLRGYKHHATVK